MSEENGKVCCNCRHNIRIGKGADMECYCDIDWHYICYADCMLFWCRRWAKEERKEHETLADTKA